LKYLLREAGAQARAGGQEEDFGEVSRDEVKVVHGGEDGDALMVEMVEKIEQLDLATDIEVLGGLVEDQQGGLLSKAEGNLDALALASAEFIEDAVAERGGVGEIEGSIDGQAIGAGGAAEQAKVGGAALLDELLDGVLEGNFKLLGDDGDQAGDLAGSVVRERTALEQDRSGGGPEGSRGQAQEGGFADAVGADERGRGVGSQGKAGGFQDGSRAGRQGWLVGEADALEFK
jgi:hypothetical protein